MSGGRAGSPGEPTGTITAVTGGSGGLAASYDEVLALATTYDTAGDRLRDRAGVGARVLADGDLLESALLSPLSFADAETAVLAATTGPDGVLVESLAWETDAVLIRVTVRVLRETDELVHATFEVLDHAVGRAIGFGLVLGVPALVGAGLLVGSTRWPAWQQLPPGVRRQARDGAAEALEDWLTRHPGAVQHLVNGGGGLIDGLWDGLAPLSPGGPFGTTTFTPDTESAAGLLAMLYGDDGRPHVGPSDLTVPPGPGGPGRPGSLADLVAHLGAVAGLSGEPDSPANGTIEIQTFTGDDGRPHHIVYLPGTDDLTTLPWTQDGDVRDMATNFLLVGGADNAYQDGILQAMHDAGIGPHDPVLLAGHSMGGMEAAAILSQGSGFDVTDVVTAGSPTAQLHGGFPPGSHVLSLEHHGDVVPLLDGEDNPDSAQQVTVQFTGQSGGGGITDHHGFATYTEGAAAVDASDDPSLQDSLQSLSDHGFLGPPDDGTAVTSQVFQITRDVAMP